MAKRRVTISVDEDVLRALEAVSGSNLSAVATEILRDGLVQKAHQRALLEWLDELDRELGPPTPEHYAAAERLLDEAAGLTEPKAS